MARIELTSRRLTSTIVALAALAASATLGGCGLFGGGGDAAAERTTPNGEAEFASTQPVETTEVRTTTGNVPGVLQPMNRPIVQGPLPLFYLVESPMTLRITNVDTGEEIAVVDVKPPQILRVEKRGVILGTEVFLGASLAQGTYAMTPLSPNAGVIRATQGYSRPTVPTTSPAAGAESHAPPTADTPPPAN